MRTKGQRNLSQSEIERVIELYDQGNSRLQIQIETKLTQPTVRKILKEAGYSSMNMTTNSISDEQRDEVVRLSNMGFASREIARRLNISKKSVLNIIRERVKGIKPVNRSEINVFEFIQIWQENDSCEDVARILGLTMQEVYSRAYNYRAKGVPLKKYPTRRGYNWDDLKEFAELFEDGTEDQD